MTESPAVTDIANLLVAATALIVAVISAVYGWRAYAIQLTSSTPRGIQFMFGGVMRTVPIGEGATATRIHRTLGVLARGPGIRYGATVAVWGEVDARFLTDTQATWAAEDVPLTAEMHAGQHAFDRPVYFGLVWESPSFFRRRFTAHGYRVRLKWDRDKGIQGDWLEVWNDRTKSWNMMPTEKSTGARSSNPVEEAHIVARDLVGQMDIKAKSNKWM